MNWEEADVTWMIAGTVMRGCLVSDQWYGARVLTQSFDPEVRGICWGYHITAAERSPRNMRVRGRNPQ